MLYPPIIGISGSDKCMVMNMAQPLNVQYCPHHIKSKAQIEQIPLADIEARLGFKYMTSDLAAAWQSVLDILPNYSLKQAPFYCEKITILANPEQTLVIHEVAPTVGKGLTTLVPIKKCTIIGEYVGEIISENDYTDNAYTLITGYSKRTLAPALKAFELAKNPQAKALAKEQYIDASMKGIFPDDYEDFTSILGPISYIKIEAKYMGNLMRFANHISMEEREFNGFTTAKSNLFLLTLPSLQGIVKQFLMTLADIELHEELGWDYGSKYDFSGGEFSFFDSETTLLINKNGTLHDPSYDFKIQEPTIQHTELTEIEVTYNNHFLVNDGLEL